MEEKGKKIDNLERAKTIMGRFDPALLSVALKEIMVEPDEAEEADVSKAKEAIKQIYDSIPEGKDKKSIISKAIMELNSDIVEKEVKAIKENLAGIDKETLMQAAKDHVDIRELYWPCIAYHINIPCLQYCLHAINPCKYCESYIGPCHRYTIM